MLVSVRILWRSTFMCVFHNTTSAWIHTCNFVAWHVEIYSYIITGLTVSQGYELAFHFLTNLKTGGRVRDYVSTHDIETDALLYHKCFLLRGSNIFRCVWFHMGDGWR
jgi:uncharacterized membrane protein